MKKIRKLVIDCSRWIRGRKGGESKLLNENGNMCCLGFECLARGLTENDIRDRTRPCRVSNDINKKIPHMTFENFDLQYNYEDNDLIKKIMRVNDDGTISDSKRIGRLCRLFAKRGIKVGFINRNKEPSWTK